jgi:hypothetical protein
MKNSDDNFNELDEELRRCTESEIDGLFKPKPNPTILLQENLVFSEVDHNGSVTKNCKIGNFSKFFDRSVVPLSERPPRYIPLQNSLQVNRPDQHNERVYQNRLEKEIHHEYLRNIDQEERDLEFRFVAGQKLIILNTKVRPHVIVTPPTKVLPPKQVEPIIPPLYDHK